MCNRESKQLSETIGLILDAAMDVALWPEAISSICNLMNASSALLFTPLHTESPEGVIASCGLPDEFLRRYTAHFHEYDVWTQAGVKKNLFQPGRVVTDEDLLPREELLESYYYREFLASANTSRLCCAVIFGQDYSAALPTVISIYRGVDSAPFKRREKAILQLMVPHLTRALGRVRIFV